MHRWGEDFDWEGLDNAINHIAMRLRYYRVPVYQAKEKYGTCRIYCSLGWSCLHDITHPGHAYYHYPEWLIRLDIYVLSKLIRKLNFLVVPMHKWIYRKAYKEAVDMYPELEEEICSEADYVELLDFYVRSNE